MKSVSLFDKVAISSRKLAFSTFMTFWIFILGRFFLPRVHLGGSSARNFGDKKHLLRNPENFQRRRKMSTFFSYYKQKNSALRDVNTETGFIVIHSLSFTFFSRVQTRFVVKKLTFLFWKKWYNVTKLYNDICDKPLFVILFQNFLMQYSNLAIGCVNMGILRLVNLP